MPDSQKQESQKQDKETRIGEEVTAEIIMLDEL